MITAESLTASGALFKYTNGQPEVKLDACGEDVRRAFVEERRRRFELFERISREKGIPVHRVKITDKAIPRHGACECCGDELVHRHKTKDGTIMTYEGCRGGTCMLCVTAIRDVLRSRGAAL